MLEHAFGDNFTNVHMGINEKSEYIEISAWMSQKWTDSKLRWNPLEYDNITDINVLPDKVTPMTSN